MSVCSIFWIAGFLLLAAAFFWISDLRLRQGLLALCSVAFIATYLPDLTAWAVFLAFILSGYGAARLLMARPSRALLGAYLCVLVAVFIILKQYTFAQAILPAFLFQRLIVTAGLSYILFRQIQVVVDASQGQITRLSLWTYFNFQINLFAFAAGPIQRFEDFSRYWDSLTPVVADAEAILLALLRLFLGVIKISLIAFALFTCYLAFADGLTDPLKVARSTCGHRFLFFLGALYCMPLYIYFNFSGYCDIVIAAASLVGLKLPENFERPYLSRNMIDFWTRWHRTLGFWIRDYIFTPLYKATASTWPSHAAAWAVFCYFTAFFLAGLWHGSSWNYVAYGLLNGAGLATAKAWENFLVRTRGRAGLRAYLQNPLIRVAAIVLTLHFACFTMLIFGSDVGRTWRMMANIFVSPAH
jgi:D-alanyl-lipoteichoic acid acyltransferase DltB (MBOAT superfamily)